MSEIVSMCYCPKCKEETPCLFSGSGKNGICDYCDNGVGDLKMFDKIITQNLAL